MQRVRLRGEDALNTFTIQRAACGVCGRRHQLVVNYDRSSGSTILCNCGSFFGNAAHLHEDTCAYRKLLDVKVYRMLTWVDILKHTILGKAFDNGGRGYIGMQCGCYAKLHRQIVHVADGVQKKIDRSHEMSLHG